MGHDPRRRRTSARSLSRSLKVVAVVAFVAIAIVTAQQLWRTRVAMIENASQQVSRLNMVFAEQTGRAVETVDLILRNASDLMRERVRDQPSEVAATLSRRIAGVRQIVAMALTDQNGIILAATTPELAGTPLPPAGMAALEISRTDRDAGLRISEPMRSQDGRWLALMTRPLLASDGKVSGLAVAYLNLAYFEDFYKAVELQENGAILLHHRDGTVLARFPRVDNIIGSSFADQPPFTDTLSHSTAGTVIMDSPIDGSRRILAIRALKLFPLAVSVSVGQSEILAGWWAEVWVFSAAAVLGGVGLVGVLLLLSSRARDVEMADRLVNMQERARIASLDALTGLLNRNTLAERLERRLAEADAGGGAVVLLFLDLDGFKRINDVQGHKAGDVVLRAIAARLATVAAAASADVSRWGGDEFVIVMSAAASANPHDPSDAVRLANDILREIALPIDVDGAQVRVGGTVGMAAYPQDGRTPDLLVSAADAAMYDGKQSGGDVVRVYDPALADAVALSNELENDLRLALGNETLCLVYQPIVEMPERRCVAFEALVRWEHPLRGEVPPAVFVPVAEHSGLIGRLGQWVLQRACMDAASWPDSDHVAISVNVSLAQVVSGELERDVDHALAVSGMPAHRLVLELTESMVGTDHLRILPVLRSVRAMGVRIALDDFGTGFSSLSRLREWPINIVKIDKSFVASMARDGSAVIRATLLVAREYGLSVTVEGVETVEQWKELASLDVRSFQGFLFSRALDSDTASRWLAASQNLAPPFAGLGWARPDHPAMFNPAVPG